jgi:pyruvate dehydrogenase E1 component alpha subunit
MREFMPLKNLADFSITHMQILDEEGNADKALEPKIAEKELLNIYATMVYAREGDQRALKLQRQGRIGTFAPNFGHEAVSIGAAYAMRKEDWFVGAFRELGGRLYRGEKLSNYYLYHNGFEEGNVSPGVDRTLPIAVIVGSQLPHAVGLAYAMRYQGEKETAVVVFFGDGATSEGDFHEALNFASVWKAPVVFVCQNNQWAISLPVHKQMNSRTIAQKAIAYDMPGIQVDGNDVLAVIKAVQDALERARRGEGPTLIEAVTYRLVMHTTSDDPHKYRSEEEEKSWWLKEPLLRFRKYLEKKGLLDETKQKELEENVKRKVDEAVRELENFKPDKPDAPFDYVFGGQVEEIERQRAEFLRNLELDRNGNSHG